jgi:hypothetical protein
MQETDGKGGFGEVLRSVIVWNRGHLVWGEMRQLVCNTDRWAEIAVKTVRKNRSRLFRVRLLRRVLDRMSIDVAFHNVKDKIRDTLGSTGL